ncbi:MAG TPA: DUF4352 domain-containing protein [Ktedonobacteraceae bacterium]|nr:DUF4352 domain-containing protein [Ktedonobacteraceae bacterium]
MNICSILTVVLLLAACSSGGNTNTTGSVTATTQSGTAAPSTPGVGPVIVQATITVQPGTTAQPGTTPVQDQVVKLADRTLTIAQASKQAGTDASSSAISITVTVTNTSNASIMNESGFYLLQSAEGDAFGGPSSVSTTFFGAIPSHSSRQGTIVFQVPTGAVSGIHLLYHPEIATDTALIPLNL